MIRSLPLRAFSIVAVLATALLAPSCGGTTPTVRLGARPKNASAGVAVSFPPPPAKIEVIPLRRRDDCLWRDGYWEQRSGAWVWVKGAWLEESQDCSYAPPVTRFESTPAGKTLVYRKGEWFRRDDSKTACDVPAPCTTSLEEAASEDAPSGSDSP